MESLIHFAERFRADVQKKCGCPVYKKALKSKFNLHKNEEKPYKVFAYINERVTLGRFHISAWEKHAQNASVAHLADKRAPKGMWRSPALIWYVKDGDDESYEKAVSAFSKICKKR